MQQSMKELRWFLTALLLLFIGLKLSGHIEWSWWWVMAPFWIPFSVSATLALILVIARLFETEEQKKIRRAREALNNMANALRRNK